jgi:ribosomal protein S18 acetylase RimI-like enzyme
MRLRPVRLADLPGVYEVCRLTAAREWEPPDAVAHVYAGPYVVHSPEFVTVLADELGIAGYVVGVADSRAFEAELERSWWPALREQFPSVEEFVRPPRSPEQLVDRYPAHLHIDLLDRARGRGLGRELIERLCGQLVERGVPGIHLGVSASNPNAIAFYEHLGFETAEADEHGRWMVRDLG